MECKICLDQYNQSEKRPRVLPCGHTFCSMCVNNMCIEGSLTCPNCRVKHGATGASQFPFSFELEELMLKMKEKTSSATAEDTPVPEPSIKDSVTKGLNRKIILLMEEQKSSVLSATSDCEEMLSQLQTYNASLQNIRTSHQNFIDKLIELTKNHRRVQDSLDEETEKLSLQEKKGLKYKQTLKDMSDALEKAKSAQDANIAIGEADNGCMETEDWTKECLNIFPDMKILHHSSKVLAITKAGLEVMAHGLDDAGETCVSRPPSDAKCNIVDMLEMAKTVTIKMEALMETNSVVRQLVKSGQVVAVQRKEGRLRHAKLSVDGDHDNAICLHHLQDDPPPAHVLIIPYEEVIGRVEASSALAFLDLSWPESPPRRVWLRMDSILNAAFGRQFVLMCTAELGPTYANTKFQKHVRSSPERDYIIGGDYDGRGGKPIVSDLSITREKIPYSEGALSITKDNLSTMFAIITESTGNLVMSGIFGKVEKGLEVIKSAARNADNVTVVDCGVVVNTCMDWT